MASTSAFGWETPDDTDLVKDGAAAIRTLGNSIDTSMSELKGGTTGQVLSKTSNTDMDFTWVAQDDSNAIQNAIVDAKGDLIAATAADTPARLAVGTNGQVLTADSTAATGLKWATAASGGGMTLISTTTLSGTSTTITVASNTYLDLVMYVESIDCQNDVDVWIQLNGETGATAYTPVIQGSANGSAFNLYTKTNGVYLNQTGVNGFGTGSDNFSNITIFNANSTIRKVVDAQVGVLVSGTSTAPLRNTCTVASSAAISSIVFKNTTGNFDGGTIKLYGVK